MKAVILAAGEGTRLEPLTNVRPKPMLPVANRPVLEYVIDAVAGAGIDEIVLVVGYKQERIQSHFGDGDDWGVEISYVEQATQLGTAHALLQAESRLGGEFLVLNGDKIVTSDAIERVVDADSNHWVMTVTRAEDTGLYGVVSVDGTTVVDITEKPGPRQTDSELVNAGIYVFDPGIFSAIRETETEGELGLPTVLNSHLEAHPVETVNYTGPWFDITRPWDLLSVNGCAIDQFGHPEPEYATIHETATVVDGTVYGENISVDPNATVLRGTALGKNVSVGANAVVENAVIMDDVSIGASAVVRDCIVGANAEIGPGTIVEGGVTDLTVGETIHRAVRFGGIIGDNATLGGRVTVLPGTRLGNESDVESGVVLRNWFESGSLVRRG